MNEGINILKHIICRYKRPGRNELSEAESDPSAYHDFVGMVSERKEGGRISLTPETIAYASNIVIVDRAFRQHDIGAGVLIEFVENVSFKAGDTMWLAPSRILIYED